MAFQANAFQANAFQISGAVVGHEYDTGLAKPQRTLIREAIVARLAPLLKANGKYLHAVVELPKPISGVPVDADGFTIDDGTLLLEALNGAAPGVAIALGRKTYESAGSAVTEARAEIELEVYIISQHQRDIVDGRLAQDVVSIASRTADPGIETMLEHVEELLIGADLGIDTVAEIRPVDEDETETHDRISVWRQRYTIAVGKVINTARGITQVVTEIQGRHTEAQLALVPDGPPFSLAPLITLSPLEEP